MWCASVRAYTQYIIVASIVCIIATRQLTKMRQVHASSFRTGHESHERLILSKPMVCNVFNKFPVWAKNTNGRLTAGSKMELGIRRRCDGMRNYRLRRKLLFRPRVHKPFVAFSLFPARQKIQSISENHLQKCRTDTKLKANTAPQSNTNELWLGKWFDLVFHFISFWLPHIYLRSLNLSRDMDIVVKPTLML